MAQFDEFDEKEHQVGMATLQQTAREMVSGGRGILAADESIATMTSRLEKAGLPGTPETRRAYRQMLVTTPRLSEWISGVIFSDETFGQRLGAGRSFPQATAELGVLPGIKVDTGAKPLAGTDGETVTEGLDGLRERLAAYVSEGAKFAKWRAVIRIGAGQPSQRAVIANAHALARYAALCQEAGVVPIVEPEVLMEGDHTLARCAEVTEHTLHAVFDQLALNGVLLEGMVLKPNMVLPGKDCPQQASVAEVAEATVRCLLRAVPAAVPGVAFLSGGQGAQLATEHLNEMNRIGPHPWSLTYSYGRALVDEALAAWHGDTDAVPDGQQALAHRASCTSAAQEGRYNQEMELAGAGSRG